MKPAIFCVKSFEIKKPLIISGFLMLLLDVIINKFYRFSYAGNLGGI